MYVTNTLLRYAKVSVPLLSTLVYCICTSAYAADQQHTKAPVQATNHQTLDLKLDLGLALGGDDCEEDYADLLTAAAMSDKHALPVTMQPPAKDAEMVLAKLEPVEKFDASRAVTADIAPAKKVVSIQAARSVRPPSVSPAAAAAPVAAPVSAPVTSPVNTAPAAGMWEIVPADKTLNTALARWAATAGWQLLWELPVDYAVDARTSVPGTFEEAVGMVAESMETAEIPMKAIFYEGNRVLRIVAKGAE